ncbi:MAG: hypothetical protein ACRDIY_21960 [Chloroflexota bacterium]
MAEGARRQRAAGPGDTALPREGHRGSSQTDRAKGRRASELIQQFLRVPPAD